MIQIRSDVTADWHLFSEPTDASRLEACQFFKESFFKSLDVYLVQNVIRMIHKNLVSVKLFFYVQFFFQSMQNTVFVICCGGIWQLF